MSNFDFWQNMKPIISNYIHMAKAELHERWQTWDTNPPEREVQEVIGALVARQVTLTLELASAPTTWNVHLAPIVLRTMVDNHINLAWIFMNPLERTHRFIEHGLGQEKLVIEHTKAKLAAEGKDTEDDPDILQMQNWLDGQRYTFLTAVNVGSWSGTDTRKMAAEAGCSDLYNQAYTPYSSATHNMWNHVGKHNLGHCPDPLHKLHRVPVAMASRLDTHYVIRAAQIMEQSFRLFDERTSVKVKAESALVALVRDVDKLDQAMRDFRKRNQDSETSVELD